jgi:hypothetical protein
MLPRVGVRVDSLQVDVKEVGSRDGNVLKQDVERLCEFITRPLRTFPSTGLSRGSEITPVYLQHL